MKLLTLNAHSHLETDYDRKVSLLADFILDERPDLIALQESSQPAAAPEAGQSLREGLFPSPDVGIPLRTGNHAAALAALLRSSGIPCSWTWLPVKLGYGRLDEGLAFLSLTGRIPEARSLLLTRSSDYRSWKTRRALIIRTEPRPDWFVCTHMGWWDDPNEPFLHQWNTLNHALSALTPHTPVWLMGDFNSPAELRGEGYDRILADGWHDLMPPACASPTVHPLADGWHGRSVPEEGVRIDYIFRSRPCPALHAGTVLNGTRGPLVSDHAGVLIETQPDTQEE